MNESYIEELNRYLNNVYYTPVLPIVATLYSLSILRKKDNISLKVDRIAYLVSTFTLFGVGMILDTTKFLSMTNTCKIINLWNVLFSIVETVVFCRILSDVMSNKNFKKRMATVYKINILVGLIVLLLEAFNSDSRSSELANYFATAGLYILVIGCVTFFYGIYKSNNDFNFSDTILIYALFSYSIFSIPYFLLAFYVDYRDPIDDVFYAIHYFLIGFLCFTLSLSKNSYLSFGSQKKQTQ